MHAQVREIAQAPAASWRKIVASLAGGGAGCLDNIIERESLSKLPHPARRGVLVPNQRPGRGGRLISAAAARPGRSGASVRLSADSSRDRLVLTAGDASIVADGSVATRVTFRAVDAYRNQRSYVNGAVDH
ncbi:MAG TPA: hypothetical protein VLW50_05465 [Streptosporangiaceae bacterium]|nr:hypothetical protein [Streptosporangiaceae bacterium]